MIKLIMEVEFYEEPIVPMILDAEDREDIEAACIRGVDKAGYCVTKSYWVEDKEVK